MLSLPRRLLTLLVLATAWLGAQVDPPDRYLSLEQVAVELGMHLAAERSELYAPYLRLVFEKDSQMVLCNGLRCQLSEPVQGSGASAKVARADLERVLRPLLRLKQFGPARVPKRIFIDAGHGGSDPGHDSTGLAEKTVALDLALRLGRQLKARGFEVAYSRQDDRFLPLADRPKRANAWKADLFLSLHFNGAAREGAAGAETFVLTPLKAYSWGQDKASEHDAKALPGHACSAASQLLAFFVQQRLVHSYGQEDRGLKWARWAVLKSLECPGVLIEAGFLTNAGDRARIASDLERERMAEAIAEAVSLYTQTLKRNP